MNANLQMLRRSPSAEQLKLQNLRLRVGDYAVDVGALRVIGEGETARLTSKAVAVLLELVRHAGNTVGREDLLETVWKDRVTTPDVLTQAIKELRRAFGDGDKPARYIETIPKVGYRLLADVSVIEADEIPFGRVEHMSLRAENESWVEPNTDEAAALAMAAAARALAAEGGVASVEAVPTPTRSADTARAKWMRLGLPLAVLLVLVAAGLYFARAAHEPSPWQVSNRRAITSDPEAEILPHISPDGTRVAFGKLVEATGLDRLFIRAIEPSQLVALAPHTETAHDIRPVWSPDGSRIAYQRITRTSCMLYIVASMGGHEREIGDCQDFTTSYFDFTPDGQELVIALRSDGPQSDLRPLRWNIATGAKQPLNYEHASGDEDFDPRYSPNGQWIAFRRGISPYSDLYLMHADGSGAHALTHLSGSIRGYTWTADSSALVFSSNHSGKFELYAVDAGGGALQRLQIAPAAFPDAARGTKTLVYQIQRTTSSLAEIDVSAPRAAPRKFAASTGSEFSPAVSPDGSRIAFLSDRSGCIQLWLYDFATNSVEAVTDYTDALLSNPVWRADSAAVVVSVRQEPASSRLIEVDLASRRAREISGKNENVLFGSYGTRPDSFLLAIGASGNAARLVQREHPGREQADTLVASSVEYAEADAASGQVYYTHIGTSGLFRRSLPTGDEQRLTDKISSLTVDGWHLVGGKVWYIAPVDIRLTVLREFDPEQKADRAVAEIPITIGGVQFGADREGKRLYLEQVSNQDADIGAFELDRPAKL